MDVRSYVASTRFAVIVTAIVVAIPSGYLVLELTANESLAFLAMFTLGVSVPQVYSRSWPEEYDRPLGVAWAVGACAVTLLVFLVAYAIAALFFAGLWAAIAAFLVVQVAISATSRTIERRLAGTEGTEDADVEPESS